MFKRLTNKLKIYNKRFFSTNTNKREDKQNNELFNLNTLFFATSLSILSFTYSFNKQKMEETNIHDIKMNLNDNQVEEIEVINNDVFLFKMKNTNEIKKVNLPGIDYLDKKVDINVPITFSKKSTFSEMLPLITTLGFFGIFLLISRRQMNGMQGLFQVVKNNEINIYEDTGVKFKDIIGQKNALNSMKEFVDILKNYDKYEKVGVKVPKGALLCGPPGTGKTLLAKAIAGESGLPFVSMNGSDFNAMFVGVGAMKIRKLYEEASKIAEEGDGCIVFIDEIDAIGQKRGSNAFGGNSERENTLNQLLTEMDGFDTSLNVLTIAATNRADILDNALLRPGRIDRKVIVDIPTKEDRKDLFKYYLDKINISKYDEYLVESCVNLTPGFSGADISNICNEAAIIGIRNGRDMIIDEDVKNAIDYVMLGNEKNIKLTEKEEILIAYHEAGHAYISYILNTLPNPVKVSIVPRENGALGFSQSEVGSEILYSKQIIEDQIKVLMAGRICEQIFLSNKEITNGASDDINKATQLAKKYVRSFGMVDSNVFLNFEEENDKFYSDFGLRIKDELDAETIKLINDMYLQTKNLILSNKKVIEKIKEKLIENRTIYIEDLNEILCNT